MSAQAKIILQKAMIYGGAIIVLAIFQTAFFSHFPLFGAIPDLMLPASLAIAMFEGERGGAASGIFAGFFIEAIGGVGLSLLPIFYMLCAVVCALLCRRAFSRGPITFALFALCSFALRSLVTLIYISFVWQDLNILDAVSAVLIPEYFSGLVFAFVPFILIRLLAKIFHRTRELDR